MTSLIYFLILQNMGISLPKIQCQVMRDYDKYDKRIILEDICPGLDYKPRGPPEVDKNRKKPWKIGLCEKYHRKKVSGAVTKKKKPKFKVGNFLESLVIFKSICQHVTTSVCQAILIE